MQNLVQIPLLSNHLLSFKHQYKTNAPELSRHVWRCKDAGLTPTVSWKNVHHAPAYAIVDTAYANSVWKRNRVTNFNLELYQHSQQTF